MCLAVDWLSVLGAEDQGVSLVVCLSPGVSGGLMCVSLVLQCVCVCSSGMKALLQDFLQDAGATDKTIVCRLKELFLWGFSLH